MAVPFIKTAFSSGELAPSLWGHVDNQKWGSAASTMRNCFVGYRGGSYSRPGTEFLSFSKQKPPVNHPRLINFQFNNQQGYALEFGEQYVRFIFNGGYVVEPAVAITAISPTDPIHVTAPGNTFNPGDWIVLQDIAGMPQLSGNGYIVGPLAGPGLFTLLDQDGGFVDGRTLPPYGGLGNVARIYEIASPYGAADLPLLKYTQSADVMSLTHPSYPPYDLARHSSTLWTMTPTSFSTSIGPPASATASATTQPNPGFSPPTLPAAYAYEVTAVDSTGQESVPSPIASLTNGVDMAATSGSNVVNWTAPTSGAPDHYNVYRAPTSYNTQPGNAANALPVPAGALFGFVGEAFGTQFVDTNITADFAITPPDHVDPFAPGQILAVHMTGSAGTWTNATVSIATSTGSGFIGQAVISGGAIVAVIVINPGQNYQPGDTPVFTGGGTSASGTLTVGPQTGTYPGVVSYFQQRRVYADTLNQPDTYWMSQPGAYTNFDSSEPVKDTDAIEGTPWSEKVDGIQWMLQMPLGLVTFTGSGVWQVGAPGSFASSPQPITPTNQVAAPQSAIGASSTVPPLRDNWDILYVQSKGYAVRALTYQIYFNIYAGTDISWPSSHLLTGYSIHEWCHCEEPFRLFWIVRSDGALLSLTYLREQEIAGWARHDTLGQVRSVCSVTESNRDSLYLVVQRPVAQGGTRYFIERMNSRLWSSIDDSWCVDCATGTPLFTPAAELRATTSSGTVVFAASAPVLGPVVPGTVIRMGGGIASVTQQIDATQIVGHWNYPCQTLYPNDPQKRPIPAEPGGWSWGVNFQILYLPHLIGESVVGTADGVPVGPFEVAGPFGAVTLPFPASRIVLGLGFTAQTQSVYLDTGNPTIQGRRKSIYAVTVRSERSSLSQVGANQPDAAAISPPPLYVDWKLPQVEPVNISPQPPAAYTTPGGATAQPLFTGDQFVRIPSEWNKRGQVACQQTLPLPLSILAFIPEVIDGDRPEEQIQPRPPQAQPRGR